jgi:hypothetical protein
MMFWFQPSPKCQLLSGREESGRDFIFGTDRKLLEKPTDGG